MSKMVEDFRYGIAYGNPDPEPLSYKDDYVLPIHREKLLQHKFKHERDTRIHFHEKPHIYTVDGKCVDISVSSLIKDYIENFDPDAIIAKMKMSKYEHWPRLKYAVNTNLVGNDISQLDGDANVLMVNDEGKTKYAGKVSAFKSVKSPPKRIYTYDRAMTDEEIKTMWQDCEARNRGTEAHYQIELWINSEPARLDQMELKVGLQFVKDQLVKLGAKAYRTEWEIFAEDEDVAGSVDCIAILPDESLIIVDWKRTPHLRQHMHNHYGKSMKEPLSHLDDCDGCKYGIQLGIYAWIIEKYYGKRVSGLALCSLHPEAPYHTWVPYLRDEIDFLMRKRREKVASVLRANADAGPQFARCHVTNQLAFDAIKYNGIVYSEKEFLVRHEDEEYEVLEEERLELGAFLSTIHVVNKISKEEEKIFDALPWKSRIADDGCAELILDSNLAELT